MKGEEVKEEQTKLFEPEGPGPPWVRLRGGCGGIWRHRSGWRVCHCGHPTALWPYFGLAPGGDPGDRGQLLLTGGFGVGTGFRLLADAKRAVEGEVAKREGGKDRG